ncbi:MAG: M23 family metallopeptidase [Treponema sp.]|nr:M23 family metallopeptidase [Treponema sp.]
MKNIKKTLLATLALALAASVFAKNARFDGASYSISLDYNDTVLPGDPVFVRMRFENVKAKKKAFAPAAKAEIKIEDKSIGTSDFYSISKKGSHEYMTGLPISSWAKSGEYNIVVSYTTGDEGQKSFDLPLTVGEKTFDSGTITLNQTMNNISKNTSPEKVAQSKKLNDIINSINPESVYNLKKFIAPVKSTRRTTSFAERIIYKYPSGKESTTTHAGIDFGVPTGTEIVAPAAGKVVMAENRIATGWTIIVEHLPGLYTMYYHMSQLKVKEGQNVQQGDLLGLSGSTGFSTGTHLHWEVRLNSVIVNPDYFIEKDWSFNEL